MRFSAPLFAAAAVATQVAVFQGAIAQNYPTRPIRLIVPHAPGGAVDSISRSLSEPMRASLGQPVIVDNRPGASGIIGTEACSKAAPDGHTLCATNNDTILINTFTYAKLPYDVREFAPVIHLGEIAGIALANPAVPANTVRELVELGKKKPGSIRWATFGAGSIVHLYADWLANSTGAGFVSVHYKGAGPAHAAVIGGEVEATMFAVGPAVSFIKAGKFKAIAILGSKRSPLLPDVPTLAEQGFEYYITPWMGLFAPVATPVDIVRRLNTSIARIMEDPKFKEQVLDRQTIDPVPGSPEVFAEYIRRDRERTGQIVKISGVRLD